MSDTPYQWIYVTCKDADEASSIAEKLLEKHLIACANILPPMQSCFRWEGVMQQSSETVMIVKSRADLFEAIEREICAYHSYDCPCIIALDISQGHQPFLQWIGEETQQASPGKH